MKTNILIPGIALAVGLGVGFGVGKGGEASSGEANGNEVRTRSTDRSGAGADSAADKERKQRSISEIYRQPGQIDRVQGLLDYYSNLSADQFAAEAEKLDSLPFNERILASFLLFGKWAEVDPTAAMAFTDTMGFAGAFVRPTVLQGWASTDPVNAAKYYTDNPQQFAMMDMMGGRGRGMGAQGAGAIIAGEWAKQDPDAALEWASSLKSGSGDAMRSVVSEVAKSDPSKAAAMAATMPEKDRKDAYESIALEWGAKNFTEASAWANGLPADQRDAAMASAIAGLSQSSPELAATELSKMTDANALRDAAPTVVKNLARQDVKGSMDLVNGLSDDDAKRETMREVMPIWTASDSAAALDFVKSQTSADVKDSAARSYVFSNSTAPFSEQAEVAAMISDERDQARTSGMVAMRWMQQDEAGATEYINSNPTFSDEAKKQLLSGEMNWGGRDGGGGGGGGRGR
ncbi:MAG: hypothetical protein NWT08_11640 [Akkermansiaceae bacterium]|jgi:hypothetical protein|nr:hypothetical protein [Akkermansiaceae bacterium]MDP4646402.1 hypothetical protein [Akkermansiaceae bacterium]MDP4721521.1 hypothetical protein [Akkermansiaceae bacterium]MDP4780005.1 hypothetical protein [Akkermansiaceae bacterium]MDP4847069.1 hypothetical protein [Akkermansiaceae bacterium]